MTPRRIAIAVALLGAIGALIWFATREEPVEVTVFTVDRARVEATVANTRAGTVKACRRAKLAPATGGQVAHLRVHEGDAVEAGQVLVELWNADLSAQVKLAESEAAAARALADQACVTAANAQREADRNVALRKKGLVSDEAADRAVTNAVAQRAACEAARAQARVSQARVEVAQATLDRTILRAPFAGIVAEVNGEVGEFITPSPIGVPTPPAVDLVDTTCLYVSAPIDEVDAPEIEVGMPARITLDAFKDRIFPARVRRIAPYVLEVEKQARTVEIEADFDTAEDRDTLLPGYSADIEIILDVREDVVRVPTDAILEGDRVLVFDAGRERLEERRIETGISNWQYTEVISGVAPGERVVTSVGREGVHAGAYARIEPGTQGTDTGR